ncbi:ABC transporter ATP-binding protein [Brassicibacter mesophilus]|uniref:ABC transporter ATP-binding protein n=1 Tax=Brassicibacter mesophilus TaxID=745119 RepID=UPI003D205E2B
MKTFKIENLTYFYPKSKESSLKNINLIINEGEFVLVLGKSGSGKSTLARVFNGIVPRFYGGSICGKIDQEQDIGMVFQDPEAQLVMNKVESEIAFGLENMGIERSEMKKRVLETLNFLNISDIKHHKTYELSGGQKQKVAIGSTIAMGHRFLVFDEPTSQLDPVASEEILNVIKRLNEDLGYTIVLIEQRVDRCIHLANRIIFMEDGEIVFDDEPEKFVFWNNSNALAFVPDITRYFVKMGQKEIPLTVKEGRKKLSKLYYSEICITKLDSDKNSIKNLVINRNEEAVKIEKLSYKYENGIQALKEIDLSIYKGEIFGIMGENSGGKTTLLKNISGMLQPTQGKVMVKGEIGYLSQNPNDYLFNDTVYEELKYTLDNKGIKDDRRIEKTLKKLDIYKFKEKNPRDLSGGERQRVALASILVMSPEILILDEPTRGLDNELKKELTQAMLDFKRENKTVILVTHDIEFVSKLCDRVCLIFDGTVAKVGCKYDVLTSGLFYSSQINKLFTGYSDKVLTLEDALSLACKRG